MHSGSKTKVVFVCSACGSVTGKWSGQCGDCGEWNTMQETVAQKGKAHGARGYAGNVSQVKTLKEIEICNEERVKTDISELDRVLGGGLISGSVILLGGDPGIGKSTILLQTLANLSRHFKTLYVTGEESLQQIKLRAERLEVTQKAVNLFMLTETQVENIVAFAEQEKPDILVIDSIQTIFTSLIPSAPGSVGQVRESALQLVRFAKQTNTILFLIGHVTKEGTLAGPRILEHMVDTVLYFEGDTDSRYRIIRAVKNRFGAVNELGIFAMTDKGLREVTNPSAIFLSRYHDASCGSVVMVTWEGSRPMLVEIQALVDETRLANPRRVVVGFDHNRLALTLAVLHRQTGIFTYNLDIFINIVGGLKITETAVDLPAVLTLLSSLKNKPLPRELVVFGEVGLTGEIRPVQSGQERIKEAKKLGFTKAVIPFANKPRESVSGMEIFAINKLSEAVSLFF